MLTIVIPFYSGDADLCIDLLRWVRELDPQRKNKCVLITDPKPLSGDDPWPDGRVDEIQKLARKCFKQVTQIFTPYRRKRVGSPDSGWPMGANWSFYCSSLYIAMTSREPYLFFEPDSCPLSEGWLEAIEQEYSTCGKQFMGSVLDTNMPDAHTKYLNGVAVYPGVAMRYYDASMIDFLGGGGHAFDVAAAARVVPESHNTPLFYHFWGSDRTTCPTFKATKPVGDLWNVFTLDNIPKEAVLFHRNKDHTLLSLLRAKRNESKLLAA